MVKVASFLFGQPKPWSGYGFVALRLVVAAVWINSDIPKFGALAAGHPTANDLFEASIWVKHGHSLDVLFHPP